MTGSLLLALLLATSIGRTACLYSAGRETRASDVLGAVALALVAGLAVWAVWAARVGAE